MKMRAPRSARRVDALILVHKLVKVAVFSVVGFIFDLGERMLVSLHGFR